MSHFAKTQRGYIECDYTKVDGELPAHPAESQAGHVPHLRLHVVDDTLVHPNPQHWHDVRAEEMEDAGWRCRVCNDDFNLEAHHRTYARWGREQPGDLTCMCGACHKSFHKTRRLAA